MLEQYTQSVSDLKHLTKQLHDLQFQRASFESNLDAVKAKRIKVNDKILDCVDSDGVGKLVKQLEVLDTDSMVIRAKLDAVQLRIEPLEQDLHHTLPTVSLPFDRLYKSLYQHVLEYETAFLLERVPVEKREAFRETAEQWAVDSVSLAELKESIPPDTQSFYTKRPLPPTSSPQERSEVVAACFDVAQRLIDSAEELIRAANHYNGQLVVPEFEEPAPAPAPAPGPAPLLVPEGDAEMEYYRQVCKDAGKQLETLTETDRQILSVSLEQFRKGQLLGPNPMQYTT
jgi:hypothetical protein